MHSSPRVGGVLIGRKPREAPISQALNLADLRWEVGASDVRLTLVGRDGSTMRSRPFRRDLAELALAYAADGRPTAVTILHSQPLMDRKVLLHPALVDTEAGRAIARTDMIIFNLIQDEPWYVQAYLDVLNQVELYRRAWTTRQLVLGRLGVLKAEYVKDIEGNLADKAAAARPAAPRVGKDEDEEAGGAIQYLRGEADKEGIVAALTEVVRHPEVVRDPSRSPLVVKTAYFDEQLVADLLSSIGPDRTLADFDEAIREATLTRLGPLADWLRDRAARERALLSKLDTYKARAAGMIDSEAEARALEAERLRLKSELEAYEATEKANEALLERILTRWTMPVPEIAHVSGIRERSFSKTAADCFVADGAETPEVLDFLIQVTYESPAYFLKGDPPAREDKPGWQAIQEFSDESPWEFPAIAPRVREVVARALRDDPAMAEDRAAVAVLSEFALLQRLFRLGLAGELGPSSRWNGSRSSTAKSPRRRPRRPSGRPDGTAAPDSWNAP